MLPQLDDMKKKVKFLTGRNKQHKNPREKSLT